MDENPNTQPTPPSTPNPLGPNARPLQTSVTDSAGAAINPTQTVVIESLDPNGRPMEKVAPAEETEKKKPNKGLLIGIIAGAAVLFCGIIVAIVVALTSSKPDAVALAVQRLMSGETPANLAIDGSIDFRFNSEGTPVKGISIDLKSELITKSLINTSSATLTLTNYNNDDFSVKLDEVYAADGDLFLRVDGLPDLIEGSGLISAVTPTEESAEALTKTTETINNNWIKISLDEIKEMSKDFVSEDSPLSCLASVASNLNKNTNTTAEIYGKYPFVSSTTKDVTIQGVQGPVYLVNFDGTNFTNYINALNSSSSSEGLFSCLGYDSNTKLDEGEVAKLFNNMPKIYVEVDGDYDFTRIYLEAGTDDGKTTVTLDLNFSYPANVNASEPVEYVNFKDLMENITTDIEGDEEVVADETVIE